MGTILLFPTERQARILPPRPVYGPRTFVARVTKIPRYPVEYEMAYLNTYIEPHWTAFQSGLTEEEVKSFLERWRKSSYSWSLKWLLEDLSGHFSQYHEPYKPQARLITRRA